MPPGIPGDAHDPDEHAAEAAERWGADEVARSRRAWESLGEDGQLAHQAKHVRIAQGLAGLAAEYAEPSDPAVQALVAEHHAWVSLFWEPDRDAYVALGEMYATDHRFRATYDKFGDGTADLLRDAIRVWSDANLAGADGDGEEDAAADR